MVIEQLSLSDFQEIALFSLPANLNNFDKKVLTGKYCLQVFCNDILSIHLIIFELVYYILDSKQTTDSLFYLFLFIHNLT